ncbi:MAG: hypothetical protein WCC48_18280, partial [Anaeromyxobacteraceae bacterium]
MSAAACFALIARCSGASAATPAELPPLAPEVDLSGVWAGTWTGFDPRQGNMTGNWVADIVQGESSFFGPFLLTGDVDCIDGTVTGLFGAVGSVTGTLERPPCEGHQWTLTGLNLMDRTTSAVWQQPAFSATGTLTGVQIARPGGPRVAWVTPPAAAPGAIVTIVGSGFTSDP